MVSLSQPIGYQISIPLHRPVGRYIHVAQWQLGRTQCALPNSTDVGLAAHKATELLRRTGCLSRILLLGTFQDERVGPVIDAADAEVMIGLIVESVEAVVVLVVVVVTQRFDSRFQEWEVVIHQACNP